MDVVHFNVRFAIICSEMDVIGAVGVGVGNEVILMVVGIESGRVVGGGAV